MLTLFCRLNSILIIIGLGVWGLGFGLAICSGVTGTAGFLLTVSPPPVTAQLIMGLRLRMLVS